MHLIDLLTPARVVAGVEAADKTQLLEIFSRLLADGHGAALEREIFESLGARENLGSTGLGAGVAIPHGRTAGLTVATGAFIRLAQPIDFSASDNKPVDLLFALSVPQHFSNQHLLLLSQLASLFGDAGFCHQLRAAANSRQLYDLLVQWQMANAAV